MGTQSDRSSQPVKVDQECVKKFTLSEKGVIIKFPIDFPQNMKQFEPSGDVLIAYEELEKWVKKEGVLGK
jgi:hypothetical protein